MKDPKAVSRANAVLGEEDRDLLRALGQALRAHRIAGGMSRRAMADRLLIGEQTLIRMEEGDPRPSLGYYLAACRHVGLTLLDPSHLLRMTQSVDLSRRRASAVSRHNDRFA